MQTTIHTFTTEDKQVNIIFKIQYNENNKYKGLIADVTCHVCSETSTIIISDKDDFNKHPVSIDNEQFELSGFMQIKPLKFDHLGIWLDFNYGKQESYHIEGIFVLFPKYESEILSNDKREKD